MSIRLYLDHPHGHEADVGIYNGRIVRQAVVYNDNLGTFTNPMQMLQNLVVLGLPQRGDAFPDPSYSKYFLKRHVLRALSATIFVISMIYEYHGLLTIKDTTTLTQTTTQLHPDGFTPMYVTWKNPNDPAGQTNPIVRVATFNYMIPLRHVVASQTIDQQANGSVLAAIGSVNDQPWYGLPAGFWLYSGIEGDSEDNGVTYTYTVVLSSKQIEDWSQVEYLKDERGVPVVVPPNLVSNLRNRPYSYGQDSSVNGLLKVGLYPMVNFHGLFGFGG